jgi:hypothetical protein|tara:strand:- start:817 stop:1005 length:189 start_codon:yes stop_codon:yes gene_type:complete
MMSLRNSNVRLYTKLDKAHKKIFGAKDKGRQCVNTLKAFKEYNQLYRRIVEAENKDARFLYT